MSKLLPTAKSVTAHYAENSRPGTLLVLEFDKRARVARAAKATALCLAVTALCVCIPGAHFVLVPLGLLLTPLMTYMSATTKTKIVGSTLFCPHCGTDVSVLTSRERYPLYENCLSCKREIRIVASS